MLFINTQSRCRFWKSYHFQSPWWRRSLKPAFSFKSSSEVRYPFPLSLSIWFLQNPARKQKGFLCGVDLPRCPDWPFFFPFARRSLQKPRRRFFRRFGRWKQHFWMECHHNWTPRYSLVSLLLISSILFWFQVWILGFGVCFVILILLFCFSGVELRAEVFRFSKVTCLIASIGVLQMFSWFSEFVFIAYPNHDNSLRLFFLFNCWDSCRRWCFPKLLIVLLSVGIDLRWVHLIAPDCANS